MPKLFISYRRDDSAGISGRLFDYLERHYGAEHVFKDVDSIPFGVDFRAFLTNAVQDCQILLAVVGRSWLHVTNAQGKRRLDDPRDFVRIEIEAALQRGIPVVPVLVEGANMPGEDELPPSLQDFAYRNAVTVAHDPHFRRDLERLIRGLDRLLQGSSVIPPPTPPPSKPKYSAGDIITGALGMQFAYCPPGQFQMGSPESEAQRGDDEKLHPVTLTKGFGLGVTPVTVGQWRQFVQATGYKTKAETEGGAYGWTGSEWKQDAKFNWLNPGFTQDDTHPVTCVCWDDALAFVNGLTTLDQGKSGFTYQLPTEAQWEYACRAGTTTPFYFGETISTDQANYDGNYTYGKGKKGEFRQRTTPVGQFPANKWNIRDLHGGVWEWCQDGYKVYNETNNIDPVADCTDNIRVLRGGSWGGRPRDCRAAYRCSWHVAAIRRCDVGFRVALAWT